MQSVRHQFRVCQKSVCGRRSEPEVSPPESRDSFAQVESLVSPNSGCGLKPGGVTKRQRGGDTSKTSGDTGKKKRRNPLTVRMAERDRIIIAAKAETAGLPLNRFIVAAALGADYSPPPDRELAVA